MNLKNYTSDVPAMRSIARIEKSLVDMGARNVNKEYDETGELSSIKFLIHVNGQSMAFKMEARVNAVFEVLWSEVKRPRAGTRERIRSQSERTAWKIMNDWVDVQRSMVMLEQAEFIQIFLPYAYDPQSDQTYYERLKQSNFKALKSG